MVYDPKIQHLKYFPNRHYFVLYATPFFHTFFLIKKEKKNQDPLKSPPARQFGLANAQKKRAAVE
jgi:hypothetical protein